MKAKTVGLAQSVQVRLVAYARALGVEPNFVLTRFALERFLYRLSRSVHAERFVLKGALLMLVWLGETIRPTRDADLLGFGDLSDTALLTTFQEICSTAVEPDGIEFLSDSTTVDAIRQDDPYGGKRLTIQARLGGVRLRVQVDVGIGDDVTPDPEWLVYPSLLEFPRPRLRAYRPETTIAEKLHAMVVLDVANSRMKDFFDILLLAERESFDAARLADAIRATFARRRTPMPNGLPLALTPVFASAADKATQWRSFLRKANLSSAPSDLATVVERLAVFLGPVLVAAQKDRSTDSLWSPGGPWRESGKN